jgi:hypothetical protein
VKSARPTMRSAGRRGGGISTSRPEGYNKKEPLAAATAWWRVFRQKREFLGSIPKSGASFDTLSFCQFFGSRSCDR